MIYLEEINPNNWRLVLKVAKEQENYVSSDFRILARAYAYREYRSKAFVISKDSTPIGMAMYYDCDELNAYDFSQFFIDERYQGNGYGYLAACKIIDMMKTDGKFRKVILCYIEGNEAAKKMYEKMGFYHTGENDGNEIIMQMDL